MQLASFTNVQARVIQRLGRARLLPSHLAAIARKILFLKHALRHPPRASFIDTAFQRGGLNPPQKIVPRSYAGKFFLGFTPAQPRAKGQALWNPLFLRRLNKLCDVFLVFVQRDNLEPKIRGEILSACSNYQVWVY